MLPEHIKNAIETYIPSLGDWMDTERACEMAELIIETKPKVVVEIGTFKGQSLITQGFALRENNNGGKIYAIDPYKKQYAAEGEIDDKNKEWWINAIDLNVIHQECMDHVWEHQLDPWVVVIRAASQHCYQLFPHNIDSLYIDGNHSETCSTRDVENYVPRVKPSGTIWMDDCQWPTTQKALELIGKLATLERDHGSYRLYRRAEF